MGSSRSKGSKGSKGSKRSKGKTKNSYSPNDPRMKKLTSFASQKPRVIPSHHLFTGISNPSINILRKGGNKSTRKNKKYGNASLRKTSKNKSRRNSRVGGYVYGGNLGLHHFYPYNANVMTPPVIAGGKKTRSNRMVKGGSYVSVLGGVPFTQGNVSSFGNTQGLQQTSDILLGNA